VWSGFSNAATAALASNHMVVALGLQVTNANGVLLKDITYAMTAGSVTEDETAQYRRAMTVTLNDVSLVPNAPGDLLHPLSGNELRPYRGVLVPGATVPELAPLGVFRMTQPKTSDVATGLSITVTANDRSFAISQQKWTGPYTAAAGVTVQAAIQAILTLKWNGPALTFNLFPSSITVPVGTVLGVQFTSSGTQAESGSQGGNNDPWADCVALAASAGCELFFDRVGNVVMRPIPTPATSPIVATFAEGPGCSVTEGTRELDETKFCNEVILIATGAVVTNSDSSSSPGAPVVATASSTDPNLGPSGPLGAIPTFIVDATISNITDAGTAANAQLPLVMNTLDDVTLKAADNPALDAGDSDTVTRARMMLDENQYILQAITHPLDATTAMSITHRPYAVSV
jgi:hypothetical protein